MRTTGCLFVMVLAAAVSCDTVEAAELHVPGDHGTIQGAIDASGNGDVVIVSDGTYTGPNNKNLDFGGRTITVKSENGPDACIIDCEGADRGFIFQNGEDTDSVVDGFTIQHGDCRTYVDGYRYGAGVLCIGSSPTIIGCVIKQNVAWGAGGMLNTFYANPEVINCIFIENVADESGCDGDGGGMLNIDSSPTVVNCLFVRNRGGSCGAGGAIRNMYAACEAEIINCTFVDNTAGYGGCIENNQSSPAFVNCIMWGNHGSSSVGDEMRNVSAAVTLTHCDIEGGWNGPKIVNASGAVVVDGGGNINADPNFIDPANLDLYARDYHLNAGSPCVDAGTDGGVNFDLDDNPRPVDYPDVDNNGGLPDFDIGAYEVLPPSAYGMVVAAVKAALAEKMEAVRTIEAALADEQIAYDTLEELLESGDYGDLKKGDVVTARQKVHSATQHQDQAIHQIEESIEKLRDSLDALGYVPPEQ